MKYGCSSNPLAIGIDQVSVQVQMEKNEFQINDTLKDASTQGSIECVMGAYLEISAPSNLS
jgi:hypothetical protein